MPATPRATAVSKTSKVQALVNLSLVRHFKGEDGNMHPHGRLVNKGEVVDLTEAEINNFGRFVRVVDEEHPAQKLRPLSPAKAIGLRDDNGTKGQLRGSGAMDLGEHTSVMQSSEYAPMDDYEG